MRRVHLTFVQKDVQFAAAQSAKKLSSSGVVDFANIKSWMWNKLNATPLELPMCLYIVDYIDCVLILSRIAPLCSCACYICKGEM